jgi:dipeptide/tripeptide permease
LFFNFAKKVIFLFLLLTVLAFIPTVYNAVVGENYSTIKSSLSKYLGVLTIGNLKPFDQIHSSLTDKLINAIPTFFSSLIFFAFYVYWNRKS